MPANHTPFLSTYSNLWKNTVMIFTFLSPHQRWWIKVLYDIVRVAHWVPGSIMSSGYCLCWAAHILSLCQCVWWWWSGYADEWMHEILSHEIQQPPLLLMILIQLGVLNADTHLTTNIPVPCLSLKPLCINKLIKLFTLLWGFETLLAVIS